MPLKPQKFGIMFYGSTAWANGYMHTIADKGSGHQTSLSPGIRYCSIFRELRSASKSKLDEKLVVQDSPSTQWALQMAPASRIAPCPERRFVVTENFYTRHNLASQLKKIKDNEVLTLVTVRINIIGGFNRPAFKEAVSVLTKCQARGMGSMPSIPRDCGKTGERREETLQWYPSIRCWRANCC